ncbi:hypothetical protein D9619_001616 [Psilocybe cf. subviscida]|uniref:Uncharacterized protein n=1 Tax=Psilocybe cf. subviscida TaxID=2480587 RepID=A0A8H5F2L3_9AGAR|nr:hypothetical protein D9619_001616 [Psilocybe cf. subviscida]
MPTPAAHRFPLQTTSSSFLNVFMSNGSPTAYLLWAILASIFIIFLILHLWAYDRFACIKWDSGRQPGAFKRVMTYSYLATLPLLVVFSVAMTALKFKAGFVVTPSGQIIPRPFALWVHNDRHWLLPLYFILSAGWSLELVTHLEELCFWLFLLHQGPAKRDWFHSWEFKTWYFGSLVAILGMPLITLTTRRQIERVQPWLFLAGSTAGTSTTVAFLYVLARFPGFIQYVKDGGAEPDVVVRLATFYSLNQIRVLFRFLFTVPLLMLGADALSGPYPIISNPFAVDFLLMMGGIGCFISSAITLLIFFPRSITRESGYKARIVPSGPAQDAVANPHLHGDNDNIPHGAQYPSKHQLNLGAGTTPPLPNYPSYYHPQPAPYASKMSMDGEGGGEGDDDGYRDGDAAGGRGQDREEEGEGMRLSAFRYPAHPHQHEHQHEDEMEDEEGDVGESDVDVDVEGHMRRVESPGYETDAESMVGSPTAEFSEHAMSMSTSVIPHSPPMSSMTMSDSPPAPHMHAHQARPSSPSHPHPVHSLHQTSSQTAVSRPSNGSGARSDDTVWERQPADSETADVLHQRQLFRRREDREMRDTRDTRDAPLTPSSSTHYAGAGPSTSSRALIQVPEVSGSRPPSVRQKRTGAGVGAAASSSGPGQYVYHRQGNVAPAVPRSSMGDGQRSSKAVSGVPNGVSRSVTPSMLAMSSEDGGHAPTASSTGVGGIRMPVMQRSGTSRMSDRGTQDPGSRRNSVPSTLHPYLMNFTSPIDLYDDTPEPLQPPYA